MFLILLWFFKKEHAKIGINLKIDVPLLACVFEKFTSVWLAYIFEKFVGVCMDGLDLCHYFSSPGLSWDVMLNMTGVGLDLISDTDIYLFVEKGKRGGISYIAKRYSKANNKYMK